MAGQGMTHQRAPLWLSEASWREGIPVPGTGIAAAGMTRGHPRHNIAIVGLLDAPMILSIVSSIAGPSPWRADPVTRLRQVGPWLSRPGRSKNGDPRGYFPSTEGPGELQEPSP
jgi:hypothetical protein